jgi:hypothetical protein
VGSLPDPPPISGDQLGTPPPWGSETPPDSLGHQTPPEFGPLEYQFQLPAAAPAEGPEEVYHHFRRAAAPTPEEEEEEADYDFCDDTEPSLSLPEEPEEVEDEVISTSTASPPSGPAQGHTTPVVGDSPPNLADLAASLGITAGPDHVDDATWIDLILGDQARAYLDESAQATADATAAAAEAAAATVAVHDGTVAATTAPCRRGPPRRLATAEEQSQPQSRPPPRRGQEPKPLHGLSPACGQGFLRGAPCLGARERPAGVRAHRQPSVDRGG